MQYIVIYNDTIKKSRLKMKNKILLNLILKQKRYIYLLFTFRNISYHNIKQAKSK